MASYALKLIMGNLIFILAGLILIFILAGSFILVIMGYTVPTFMMEIALTLAIAIAIKVSQVKYNANVVD